MLVKVLSMSRANLYRTVKKACIIRIGDMESDFRPLEQEYVKECTLCFYDVEPSTTLPSNWNWFNKEQGEKVLTFFKSFNNEEELIIHCHAGVSRSPAIALSYAWYVNDLILEKAILEGKYAPNAQVLKVMGKLLGVYKDKKDYIHSCSRLSDTNY
ncbi:hypothetical protein [Psychrobacillus sp. FSL K6-1464]|uniref:hypothetical protein n=1 Tax=Psychrobacillus sp. FSL K6-1464 TaxID=2921545 RepID=UPI0030F6E1A6